MDNQALLFETICERRADGIMLCPARGTPPETIVRYSRQLPTILITRYLAGVEVDYVGIDNELGRGAQLSI